MFQKDISPAGQNLERPHLLPECLDLSLSDGCSVLAGLEVVQKKFDLFRLGLSLLAGLVRQLEQLRLGRLKLALCRLQLVLLVQKSPE
jgi:hypothetical protein